MYLPWQSVMLNWGPNGHNAQLQFVKRVFQVKYRTNVLKEIKGYFILKMYGGRTMVSDPPWSCISNLQAPQWPGTMVLYF